MPAPVARPETPVPATAADIVGLPRSWSVPPLGGIERFAREGGADATRLWALATDTDHDWTLTPNATG